ncbi:hypothetical protein D3C81_924980 [compost metagenome]
MTSLNPKILIAIPFLSAVIMLSTIQLTIIQMFKASIITLAGIMVNWRINQIKRMMSPPGQNVSVKNSKITGLSFRNMVQKPSPKIKQKRLEILEINGAIHRFSLKNMQPNFMKYIGA